MIVHFGGVAWQVDFDQQMYGEIELIEVAYKDQDFVEMLSETTLEGIREQIRINGRDAYAASDNFDCYAYHMMRDRRCEHDVV